MTRPPDTSAAAAAASRSVATWLGGLFVLLMALIAIGGYVRLSGSGLSIPDWPVIKVGESWSLLPPFNEADWVAVRERYDVDQQILKDKVASGALGMGSLGQEATSMAVFKRMFLVEWTHRFVAGLLGLVALACLVVSLRHRTLRTHLAPLTAIIVGMIVFQAALGGILVKSGTATHWLFLHLGMAACILGVIVWSLLRSIGSFTERVDSAVATARARLTRLTVATLAVLWIQLVLGALVAGSRRTGYLGRGSENLSTEWPTMAGRFIPEGLWSDQGLAWNLLDNAILHQWVHRWFAFVVLLHLILVFVRARKTEMGVRGRLGLQLAATLLGVQIILGLANVFLAAPVFIALGHLVIANLIIASLVLVIHDLRHEPDEEVVPSERSGEVVAA